MRRIAIKNPEEVKKQILKYFQESEDLKFAYKLQGILLLLNNKDINCSEVARVYGSTPQTLASWVHRLNEANGGNIEVLRDKPKPGRSTRLSKIELQSIKDVLKKTPTYYGFNVPKWDGHTLSRFLNKEFGIELKIRQCQRLLQKMGHANKPGRPWDKESGVVTSSVTS